MTPEEIARAERNDPISDFNLMKLTEELSETLDNNLYPFVDLDLQKRVTPNNDPNVTVADEAPNR